jgi:hypothetical protein
MAISTQRAEDRLKPSAKAIAQRRGDSALPLPNYVFPIHGPKDPNKFYIEGEEMDTKPLRTRMKASSTKEAREAMERTRLQAEAYEQRYKQQLNTINKPFDGANV